MRKYLYVVVSCLFCWITFARAQSGYLVGTSKVSIEPGPSVFSVALAGYGAPREGRFSITWNYVADVSQLSSITGLDGKFYAVNNKDQLLAGVLSVKKQAITWSVIGYAGHITTLGSLKGKLYAVEDYTKLLEIILTKTKLNWNYKGKVDSIVALTGLNGKLYAVNSKHELLTDIISNQKPSWKIGGEAPGVISITNDGTKLYTINAGDSLWTGKPYEKNIDWTEIGRYNSFTYTIRIKHITVLNDRLYAIADDGKLYIAGHQTNGDLSARAVAIRGHGKTVAIVGVDVTGFNYSFINDVKKTIYKDLHISPDAVLINAAHDHFAPVTQNWLTWGDFYHHPDESYLNNTLKKQIVKSVKIALNNLAPANLYFARGATNIGKNRDKENPQAPHDTALDVLKIQYKNKQKNSILFLTGCHPVYKNAGAEAFTLSANYPGVAKQQIEDGTGAGNAIFIEGCAGDINPQDMSYEKTGKELAGDVLKVLAGKMQPVTGAISYHLDTIAIPLKTWGKDQVEKFKADNLKLQGNVVAEKNVRWANLMLDYYKNGPLATSMPLYVQTFNIGNWKFVGLSREVTNEYGPAIRNLWPGQLVSVAGYCNDVSSYLPRDWHIKLKTYEGYDSFFWYGQTGLPPLNIRDIIIDQIKALNR